VSGGHGKEKPAAQRMVGAALPGSKARQACAVDFVAL
jgi:hypothetical protein